MVGAIEQRIQEQGEKLHQLGAEIKEPKLHQLGAEIEFPPVFAFVPWRHHVEIVTKCNTGWKIIIDRGLDIFLKYNMRDLFSAQVSLQEARKCRAFELTIVKV